MELVSNTSGTIPGLDPTQNQTLDGTEERYLLPGEITAIVFKLLIYLVGTIGNILVIFVILFLSEYKKITHWYVLQLAIADLVFLQTLAVTISENIRMTWSHHVSMCKAKQAILFINYYSSILFLMIMAIDRYLAVNHGLSDRVQRLRSRTISGIVTGLTWITAILMSIPLMLYSNVVGSTSFCRCEIRFPRDPVEWCKLQSYKSTADIKMCVRDEYEQWGKDREDECTEENTIPSVPDYNDIFSNKIPGDGAGSGSGSTGFNPMNIPGMGFGGESSPNQPVGTNGTGSSSVDYNFYNYVPGFVPGGESSENQPLVTNGSDSNAFDYNFLNYVPGISPGGETSGEQSAGFLQPGCYYNSDRPGFRVFMLFNFIVMFCIPMIVIMVCYGLIVWRLKKSMVGGRRRSSTDNPASSDGGRNIVKKKKVKSRSSHEKRRVTVMCAILVLLFAICWLPFHAVHIAKIFGMSGTSDFCASLGAVTSILAYLNSALNPYLYNFLGTFRKRIKQIKEHERMRTFLSATGLTRIGGTRSAVSHGSSSEGSKMKRSSVANDRPSSMMPSEGKPLNANGNESTTV